MSKKTSSETGGAAKTPGAAQKAPGAARKTGGPAGLGAADASASGGLSLLLRFQRFAVDFAVVGLGTFSLVLLLGLLGWTSGLLITPVVDFLRRWLGVGSFMVAALGWMGVLRLLHLRRPEVPLVRWSRFVALELAFFALMGLLAFAGQQSIPRAEAGLDGGVVGWGLAEMLRLGLGEWLAWGLLGLTFGLSLVVALGLWHALARQVVYWLEGGAAAQAAPALSGRPNALGGSGMGAASATGAASARAGEAAGGEAAPMGAAAKAAAVPPRARGGLEPQFRKNFKVDAQAHPAAAPPTSAPPRSAELPPLTLLADAKNARPDERQINLTAGLIEKTLAEFGIPAKVIDVQVGPTVTQFAVQPGFIEKPAVGAGTADTEEEIRRQKVRVAQIAGLSRDLALALSAQRLRIEAPVPGKNYIGVEVPNQNVSLVRLRPLLESAAFHKLNTPLAVGLGVDVSGRPVVADLAKMPHLLVAGTTGSGKSVGITAIAMCLIMNNSPETLRLVLIDPKKVELARFNGLPHVLGKVETDLERILGVLRWVVAEMDQRYKLLEQSRSRNIETFNQKVRGRPNSPVAPLPYLVVMIDELADLMMLAADQAEPALVRLAQLARATGIHLVVATQRPSTDVITGLIKANFPARLAFNVASSIDSRVILDTTGAEALLGKGDMLFQAPDAGSPLRAQGAIVSDHELARIIQFWSERYAEDVEEAPWDVLLAEEAVAADRDGLVQQAIAVIRKTRRVSASMLQRRLRIGYPRAARLVDELEALGVVGPAQGSGREREVLLDPDDADPLEAVDGEREEE